MAILGCCDMCKCLNMNFVFNLSKNGGQNRITENLTICRYNRAKVSGAGQFQDWPPLEIRFPYVYAQTSVLEVVLNYQYQLSWSLLRLTIPISKQFSFTQLLLFPVFCHYLTILVAECGSKMIFSAKWHGQLKWIISPSQLSAKAGAWSGAELG